MLHERAVIGWDVGGAHLKACRLGAGRVRDVGQWACPLWQGLDQLDHALEQARRRWPDMHRCAHAVTMTGEMADVFEHREEGVARIAERLAGQPGIGAVLYAGEGGWCELEEAPARWAEVASANWLATARLAARRTGDALLVDIGSTTTDLIALRRERVAAQGRTDAARLASGELLYMGVVRTPLCALAPRIAFRGELHNVMNEFFATTADVYRLTGELDPACDVYPAADQGSKCAAGTRRRLARLVGRDAREASDADWLAFAMAWRECQLEETAAQARRVAAQAGLPPGAPLVSAGCGAFLAEALAQRLGRPCLDFARDVAVLDAAADRTVTHWARVCAPSVAVAALFDEERG